MYVTNENKFYYEQSTLSTSIYENSNSTISVFPNPASDQISIEANEYLMGSEFAIYNSFGKSVRKGSITSKETIVNLNDLATGIYYLIISDHYSIETIKLVKQ